MPCLEAGPCSELLVKKREVAINCNFPASSVASDIGRLYEFPGVTVNYPESELQEHLTGTARIAERILKSLPPLCPLSQMMKSLSHLWLGLWLSFSRRFWPVMLSFSEMREWLARQTRKSVTL